MEHVNQIISKREKENIMKKLKKLFGSDVITGYGTRNGYYKFCR